MVEAGISPPVSPAGGEEEEEEEEVRVSDGDHIVLEGRNPLEESTANISAGLRVKSPNDINHPASRKRVHESSSQYDTGTGTRILEKQSFLRRKITGFPEKKSLKRREDSEESTAQIVQKFQREMTERFLQFQRESEVRLVSWEQERWRLEQSLTERWRTERRAHEKEMFGLFCGLLSDCSTALLERTKHN